MSIPRYVPTKRFQKIFYVYGLFDECGIIRYIGKGCGNRWVSHDRGTDPTNKSKNRFINQTMKALGEVPKVKIRERLTEFQAFVIEDALIKAIGRLDLGTGPLTNQTTGGRGSCGYTEEKRLARNKAVSLGHLRASPEERSERQRRRTQAKTPEQRKASAKKRLDAMSSEELSRIARNGGIALGISLWINNGKRNTRLNPKKPLPKGWNYGRINWDFPNADICANTRWINDGTKTKRLMPNESLPKGWVLGRKPGFVPKVPAFLPGGRSEWLRQRHAAKTPEERGEVIRKGWRKIVTKEARSQRVKGPNYDPEKRSAQVRKQQAELTPEQQANNIRNRSKGTCWITDGKTKKHWDKNKPFPKGWSYGWKLKASSNKAQPKS